jgi:hypothetical protein
MCGSDGSATACRCCSRVHSGLPASRWVRTRSTRPGVSPRRGRRRGSTLLRSQWRSMVRVMLYDDAEQARVQSWQSRLRRRTTKGSARPHCRMLATQKYPRWPELPADEHSRANGRRTKRPRGPRDRYRRGGAAPRQAASSALRRDPSCPTAPASEPTRAAGSLRLLAPRSVSLRIGCDCCLLGKRQSWFCESRRCRGTSVRLRGGPSVRGAWRTQS